MGTRDPHGGVSAPARARQAPKKVWQTVYASRGLSARARQGLELLTHRPPHRFRIFPPARDSASAAAVVQGHGGMARALHARRLPYASIGGESGARRPV
jgi:hypothetical protein